MDVHFIFYVSYLGIVKRMQWYSGKDINKTTIYINNQSLDMNNDTK